MRFYFASNDIIKIDKLSIIKNERLINHYV